jgi:hypothetical protein
MIIFESHSKLYQISKKERSISTHLRTYKKYKIGKINQNEKNSRKI